MIGAAPPPAPEPALRQKVRAGVLLVALTGLLAFTAAAVPFGDFRQPFHARIFVGFLWAAGACFLIGTYQLDVVRERWRVALVALIAVMLRLVLLPMEPGDDFWRYLWEGRVQNAGYNPYLFSPDSPELAHFRDERSPQINHPEVAAVYPPLIEMLLAAVARVSFPTLTLKLIFAAADLVTALLLWKLLAGPGRLRGVAMFAWNPAVAYASAGGGHFDSLMVCALTGSTLALKRATDAVPTQRWSWISASLLGLATAVKIVPLMLFPLWCRVLRGRWYVFIAPVLILILPAYFYGGIGPVTSNLRSFTDVARFHDLFWWAVEAVTIPNPYQRNWPFAGVLCIAIAVTTIRWREDWPKASFWVLGAALILSPVLHPWYVTWILPLACWRQQHAWTVLSISALASLLLWESTSLWTEWQPNWFTRSLVILPPLVWLLFERRPKPAVT